MDYQGKSIIKLPLLTTAESCNGDITNGIINRQVDASFETANSAANWVCNKKPLY